MSSSEIQEVVTRAERMREVDEKETSRVLAYSALEVFCLEMKYQLSGKLEMDDNTEVLMESAMECLDWLKDNKEAREAVYRGKLKQMEIESGKVVEVKDNTFGAVKQSFEECFQSGQASLTSGDLPKAYEWFYKAYKLTGNQSEKVSLTAVKLGQICREFAEKRMSQDYIPERIIKDINRGVSHLLIAMKSRTSKDDLGELSEELFRIRDLFFDKVIFFLIENFIK